MRPEQLLHPRPEGLYCPPGDFFVDPVRPVERAVITHGHADHARAGHGVVLSTPQTLDIMRERYGEEFAARTETLDYGSSIERAARTKPARRSSPWPAMSSSRKRPSAFRCFVTRTIWAKRNASCVRWSSFRTART